MAEAVQRLAGRMSSPGIGGARTIPVLALGFSLNAFFVFSYVVCVLGYLFLPSLPVEHSALAIFLPRLRAVELAELPARFGRELRLGLVHRAGVRNPLQLFRWETGLIGSH